MKPAKSSFPGPRRRGFTLIELIGVLVLVGIGAVFVGLFLSTSMQVYLFGKDGAVESQKTQVAMNRMIKELTWADPASLQTPNSRTVTWISTHPDRTGSGPQTTTWNGETGGPLILNGVILLDGVATFAVSTAGDHIDVSLSSVRTPNIVQTTRVFPRQFIQVEEEVLF